MPRCRTGRPAAPDPTITNLTKRSQNTAPPYFWALTTVAPEPGRRWWHYIVTCHRCGHDHVHRAGPPRAAGYLRTGRCGATYRILSSVVALPEPRVATE